MSKRVGARLLFLVAGLLLAVPSFADSQVRIVRLSNVEGDVQIDRNTGQGFERAFLNLPVTQGVKIQTKKNGLAAVEFEDGTAVRITPGTVVEFPQLSRRDSGAKVSTMHVQEGTAFVNFIGGKDDEFIVTFGHAKASLSHAVHLRVSMGDTVAELAVFKGDVQAVGPSGSVEVGKNETATFDLADQDRYQLAKEVTSGAYDAWDKQQEQYQQTYASNSSQSSYSPYSYGMSDLNYYGSFFNYPGFGMLWQPYFVGAGWDPFMNGAWAYYPGVGYGWVSGYPWGWTPYHYGTWVFIPGYGWAWQPGGTWTGVNTAPRISHPPANFLPPEPPSNSGQRTVVVNRGPEPLQLGRSANRLEIVNNTAGLGIPPGSIKNLGALSHTVEHSGFAITRLHLPPIGGSGWGRGGYSSMGGPVGRGASAGGRPPVGHASSGTAGAHPK